MSDQHDFPEPLSWNGDEDDRDGGCLHRSTGPRRDLDVSELRTCDTCGVAMHWTDRGGLGPVRIVSVGEFCSDKCANTGCLRHEAATHTTEVMR